MEKRLLVLGAGESGVGSAVLGVRKGYDVLVSDSGVIKQKYKSVLESHGIRYEEGGHADALSFFPTEVVKSPGIPDNADVLQKLRKQAGQMALPIISEIEFAGRFTDAKMLCVTGSNGKTTTTSLLYDICRRAGLNVGLGGNIGCSLAMQVAEEKYDYYVIELSSFQLDGMYDFKADVAVLLNITPDHLDRYDFCFQNYVNSKFRVIRNQGENDAFVYWAEDPVIKRELPKYSLKSVGLPFSFEASDKILPLPVEELSLKGKHNLLNSMAATLAARAVGINDVVIADSLRTFKGVEHRLQFVKTVNGVRFVNDSKATNVDSCFYALDSMTTPTVLILGGKDKGNDYRQIDDLVKEKCHTLVYMGLHNEKLHEHFDNMHTVSGKSLAVIDTDNIHDAVRLSFEAACEGDTVLLSPCCASFDLFKSYEDRGEQFMNEVNNL